MQLPLFATALTEGLTGWTLEATFANFILTSAPSSVCLTLVLLRRTQALDWASATRDNLWQ
jgi:hypothetical protein